MLKLEVIKVASLCLSVSINICQPCSGLNMPSHAGEILMQCNPLLVFIFIPFDFSLAVYCPLSHSCVRASMLMKAPHISHCSYLTLKV